jgi:predicted nucleic acid-binding protein
MYLVDTSVMIDVLKGVDNPKANLFRRFEDHQIPFGISEFGYMELLQGASNDKSFSALKATLSTFTMYRLTQNEASYEQAAIIYRQCRKSGVTPRSTIDLLIAQVAIENNLELLHNDRDFDAIASAVPELKIAVS